MSERTYTSAAGYRFGFGGQEKDDEISGNGNSYTAEYWEYDARLGRRWNVDPVVMPCLSSYAPFLNNPIVYNDPDGLSAKSKVKEIIIKIGRFRIRIALRSKSARKISGHRFPFYINAWKTPKRTGKSNKEDKHEKHKERKHYKFQFREFHFKIPFRKIIAEFDQTDGGTNSGTTETDTYNVTGEGKLKVKWQHYDYLPTTGDGGNITRVNYQDLNISSSTALIGGKGKFKIGTDVRDDSGAPVPNNAQIDVTRFNGSVGYDNYHIVVKGQIYFKIKIPWKIVKKD